MSELAHFNRIRPEFKIRRGAPGLSNSIPLGPITLPSGLKRSRANTDGDDNTAVGFNALLSNTTGINNTAIGSQALSQNTGSTNIALGAGAGGNLTTGGANIDIGNAGVSGESNTIRIGNNGIPPQNRAFIAGIRGVTTGNANAIPVVIDSAGQLGTTSSSRRFKKEIKPMDSASQSILALKPVTFSYKSDSTNRLEFGLIAEDVAQVNPNLIVRNENGEIYTVRYDAVNAMLLNEFLKEHRKNEKQEVTIASLQKQVEALTAGLQKVSAEFAAASSSRGGFEASEPAAQVANNP